MSDAEQPKIVEYPEHEKLDGSAAETVTQFLEWLQERDLFVAVSDDKGLRLTADTKPSALICGFFNVDAAKLEAERVDMINRLRELN
ncbi:hypothetical protein SEA_SICARIUS2_62 [Arthrobacter phage Sicarius2]|uniref:Uncharacterized protein n=1 Tax=Arthrobacter phage Sicarius2 TaxID=2836090 RepID=A0A8F3INX6_9CAUD|nr:hypothetical protein SEA_SICARIUS2_62 [Arthrobacter phage Sicarius2]